MVELEITKVELQQIAKACHEINRTYCAVLDDHSHKSWEESSLEVCNSAISGVMFALMNPDVTAEDQHAQWSKFKFDNGWVLGPVKCPVAKTHPSLVPYEQLPLKERVKDHLFRATVRQIRTVQLASKGEQA